MGADLMGNPQKLKGDRAERQVVDWLRSQGIPAERVRSGRSTDAGDITWPGSRWLVDVKNRQRWAVPEWWREITAEAEVEEHRTGIPVAPLLIVKRPGVVNPALWLAITSLSEWADGNRSTP
jgi:hypothetical protein